MSNEIERYKQAHNYNFEHYYNLKQIDIDAETLLNEILQAERFPKVNVNDEITPILEIISYLGFHIYLGDFEKENYLGTIGDCEELQEKYGNRKVLILSCNKPDKELVYAVAHELAHYIYDFEPNAIGFSDTYRIDEKQNDFETRANRFANAFLMPKTKFLNAYQKNSNIVHLSNLFLVPEDCVSKRLEELNL